MKRKLLFTLLLLNLFFLLTAGTLENKLVLFQKAEAKKFLQPFADCAGAGLNSGTYTSAKTNTLFFPSLQFGTTMVFVPSDRKSFTIDSQKTPTLLGGKSGSLYPKGADISVLFVPKAMLSMGLPLGNELTVLWFPELSIDKEIGKISLWGVGAKHSIDQYFGDLFPVYLAAQVVYQRVDVADIIKADALNLNMIASKGLGIIGFYGGLGYEYTEYDVQYHQAGEKINFTLQAENNVKATVGAHFDMLILNIFTDYTFANINSLNAGISVGF